MKKIYTFLLSASLALAALALSGCNTCNPTYYPIQMLGEERSVYITEKVNGEEIGTNPGQAVFIRYDDTFFKLKLTKDSEGGASASTFTTMLILDKMHLYGKMNDAGIAMDLAEKRIEYNGVVYEDVIITVNGSVKKRTIDTRCSPHEIDPENYTFKVNFKFKIPASPGSSETLDIEIEADDEPRYM